MTILFIALMAGFFFLLQRYLYDRFWNKGVSVKITFEKEEVTEGDENALFEIVENRKWLPLSTLKVKFQCSRHLQCGDRFILQKRFLFGNALSENYTNFADAMSEKGILQYLWDRPCSGRLIFFKGIV